MKPLSTIDSFCIYAESPHAGIHGAFLQIYAGRPDEDRQARYKRIRGHIEGRLDSIPMFRRYIERAPFEIEHAFWVDGADVDLEHHVRHLALPKPGTEAQLAEAYAQIYAQPMDLTRPLWEVHVIDGLDRCRTVPPNSFALVAKFHHAGVDGITGMDMTSALHGEEPRPLAVPRKSRAKSRRKPAEKAPQLTDWVIDSTRFYTRLSRTLAANAPSIAATLLKQLRPGAGKGGPALPTPPRSKLNALISAERSFTYQAVSLADVRRIQAAMPNSTVNDVYLAIAGGALRKFLAATDELPKTTLVAACPVNVRAEHEKGEGGNRFSLMRVPLGTDEPDALKRLQRIAAYTRAVKSSMGGREEARQSMAWLEMLPAPLLALVGATLRGSRLAARVPPIVNLVVTNVPGPRERLYLGDYELVDFFGVPPVVDGVGLIVGTTSYRNDLCVAVGACRTIMPDAGAMRRALRQASAELLSAAKAASRAPRKVAVRRRGRARSSRS